MPVDSYDLLGVKKTASLEEVKSAFRKKAQQFHPDTHPNDKAAEARFKEVSEAYETVRKKLDPGSRSDRGETSRHPLADQMTADFLHHIGAQYLNVEMARQEIMSVSTAIDKLSASRPAEAQALRDTFPQIAMIRSHLGTLSVSITRTSEHLLNQAKDFVVRYRVNGKTVFAGLSTKIDEDIQTELTRRTQKVVEPVKDKATEKFVEDDLKAKQKKTQQEAEAESQRQADAKRKQAKDEEAARQEKARKQREADAAAEAEAKKQREENERRVKEARKKECEGRVQDLSDCVDYKKLESKLWELFHDFKDVIGEVLPGYLTALGEISAIVKNFDAAKDKRRFWGTSTFSKNPEEYFSLIQIPVVRETALKIYRLEMQLLYERARENPRSVFESTDALVRFLRQDLGPKVIAKVWDRNKETGLLEEKSLTASEVGNRLEQIAKDLLHGNIDWVRFRKECTTTGYIDWSGILERPLYPMRGSDGKTELINRSGVQSDPAVEAKILERDFLRSLRRRLLMSANYQEALAMLTMLNIFPSGQEKSSINDIVRTSPNDPDFLQRDAYVKVPLLFSELQKGFINRKRSRFLSDRSGAVTMVVTECGILDTSIAHRFVELLRNELEKK